MSTEHPTTHDLGNAPTAVRSCAPEYEVHVSGRFGAHWAAWFEGFELATTDDGTTVLRGPVADQAALHGLLQKLRDLGIELLSLSRLDPDATTGQSDVPTQTTHNPPGATS